MTGRRSSPQPHQQPWDYSTESGVRADTGWQDAHRRFVAGTEADEDPDAVYARRIRAAVDLRAIEKRSAQEDQ